ISSPLFVKVTNSSSLANARDSAFTIIRSCRRELGAPNSRPCRPSSPLFHVRLQRRQAKLILAPQDNQALLLAELVRDDHFAPLEFRRARRVFGFVTDQMPVGI